jgi:hypothetical protein
VEACYPIEESIPVALVTIFINNFISYILNLIIIALLPKIRAILKISKSINFFFNIAPVFQAKFKD